MQIEENRIDQLFSSTEKRLVRYGRYSHDETIIWSVLPRSA